MKTVEERNELLASRGMHRQLQRCLYGFSAAVGKVRARRRFNRKHLVQLLRQLRHQGVVIVGAAHVDQLFGLPLNRIDYFRMAMAGRANSHAGVAIKKDIAINVFDPDALRMIGDQLEVRPWIGWSYKLRIGRDDFSPFWSGQSGLDLRSLRRSYGCGHDLSPLKKQIRAAMNLRAGSGAIRKEEKETNPRRDSRENRGGEDVMAAD